MDTITLRFTSHWPYNPASPIIAFLSGSRQWSHVMTIIGETAYEASMLHGCRVIPVDTAMKGVVKYQDMYVPVPNLQGAIDFGHEQDDKRYDFEGALGIPFLMSEDWADDSAWWCSEYSLMQVYKAGTTMLDMRACKRATPEHLFICNYPKSGVIWTRDNLQTA